MVRHSFPVILVAMLCGIIAGPASAENIDLLMTRLFPHNELTYIGFDSVEREDIPVTSGIDRKYLIVDFRSKGDDSREQQIAQVHRICRTLLTNTDLVRDLSRQGYDMVSVAFDRHYQYDCLP
ncbi:phosphoribosylformylglycinamidine synthase subunit PurS [Marinobacter bryozoorum]|uniref:phosphoribosylformylglycinamidine synthase subunit PurS n=1 Tax=Marinobacter bryozoorum TaxID=256324 RepID=UPI002006D025|nr:phosphoribosylformylglycinamidine synthase subunit PurS [Marinobacter bryozoorum]MCK7544530.1 phosphoribosylformylglycinamidine synthase subunit PurS [Marinobacter bryozoorum]